MTKNINGVVLIFFLLFAKSVQAVEGAQIAIYYGPGAWQEGIIAFESFCDWKGISHERVTPLDINTTSLTSYFDGIFFPGGDAYGYKLSINESGLQNIRDLVDEGGFYIGMCAGSYFACDSIEWEGEEYDYQLGLFDGWARGAIDSIAPWADYKMTDVSYNGSNPINYYSAAKESIVYYGGPVYEAKPGQDMDTLATYDAWYDLPAIIAFAYGSGRVLLCGPHPEIEEDSDRDGNDFGEELEDNGSDWDWLWSAVDWVMNRPITHPSFWINEFHYDDNGNDDGEFIEIIVPDDFTDFQNLTLTLYNGTNGQPYQSLTADGFDMGSTQDGFIVLSAFVQSISNDVAGFALDYKNNVIQFLSYEGTFVATSGPAAGLTSQDIAKSEDDTVPENYSLQLGGSGKLYREFSWENPAPATKGAVNSNVLNDQALPVKLLSLKATLLKNGTRIGWETASEINNLGFKLEKETEGMPVEIVASYITDQSLHGNGTTSQKNAYVFFDTDNVSAKPKYRLSSIDYSGAVHFLGTTSAGRELNADLVLMPNSPNPFNNQTFINFILPKAGKVVVKIYNNSGQVVLRRSQYFNMPGRNSLAIDASGLPSGVYFYRLNAGQKALSRKMVLIR